MKGDFSRLTGKHAKRKHFNGVLKQQGRVQLDSDWNELIEIAAHQRRTRTVDTIGLCGAPVHDSGFEIRHPGPVLDDLLISTGRFYAGGLLCETYPASKIPIVSFPTDYQVEVDDLKIDGDALREGQWVVVFTNETPEGIICQININGIDEVNNTLTLSEDVSALNGQNGQTDPHLRRMILYSDQRDYPAAPAWSPATGQTDLVYLDVWERHITTIEDPDIRETALGGPDTDTRVQTVAQVKIFPLPNVNDVQCSDDIDAWNQAIAPGDGRLSTLVQETAEPTTPCELGESGGYHGLENHLYRVEIHEGGAFGNAAFKWSRDNASTAYAIQDFIPDTTNPSEVYKIRLTQIGKDEVLKIKQHDWLEVSGDKTDLDVDNPGTMVQVMEVEELVLTLDRDVSAHMSETHAKVRRWDTVPGAGSPLTAVAAGPINLEKGIQVSFSGSKFKTGDYWVFAARALTGEIEELDNEPPLGIKHHYCKLALVTWNADGTADIEDCRPEFPPLTELPKGEGGGCCTVTVGSGGDFDDIQEAVNALEGGPGTICILPGVYVIDTPISIQRGWDITISGCGGKSIIINNAGSSANGTVFIIEDLSRHISIKNLWPVTINGYRVIHSINSSFLQVEDCVMIAAGYSPDDIPGVILFQGGSLGSVLERNLLVGIVGIRFGVSTTAQKQHGGIYIEKNTVFALESAISQEGNASILGLNIVNNILLGFLSNSLEYQYFPKAFLRYAADNNMFDSQTIDNALNNPNNTGFETVTTSNVVPILGFFDHLRYVESIARIIPLLPTDSPVVTNSPVIDFHAFVIDANFYNNTLLGKIGVHAAFLFESSIQTNMIAATETGISLDNCSGLTIDENIVNAGSTCIQASGPISENLTVLNNRLKNGTHGIAFRVGAGNINHLVKNAQISGNSITALTVGIELNNLAIFAHDFTVFDNSISGCGNFGIVLVGFEENLFLDEDVFSFQRVIRQNSIQVAGTGIATNLADVKIVDNDITIQSKVATSYGIFIRGDNSTVSGNSISAIVNQSENIRSPGGIIISGSYQLGEGKFLIKKIVIKSNRISGGIGNGIGIYSDIDGGFMDNNFITNMILNGIAVWEVCTVNNLTVSNNTISNCCSNTGTISAWWWKYAGIVLDKGHNIQIIGNKVLENGRGSQFQVGGFYAELLETAVIADNLFIENGTPQSFADIPQAVIHIVGGTDLEFNEDVKIVSNIVKDSINARALVCGTNFFCFLIAGIYTCYALDKRTVITSNHFESLNHTPAVKLQSSYCTFSNNYVRCPGKSNERAVDLGLGWHVIAVGNVLSGPIEGEGINKILQPNIIF